MAEGHLGQDGANDRLHRASTASAIELLHCAEASDHVLPGHGGANLARRALPPREAHMDGASLVPLMAVNLACCAAAADSDGLPLNHAQPRDPGSSCRTAATSVVLVGHHAI